MGHLPEHTKPKILSWAFFVCEEVGSRCDSSLQRCQRSQNLDTVSPPDCSLEIILGFYFFPSAGNLIFVQTKIPTNMYSLDCSYYEKEFRTIDELINDIIVSGMDPNYEITKNGKPTGEFAIDLIQM